MLLEFIREVFKDYVLGKLVLRSLDYKDELVNIFEKKNKSLMFVKLR